eukprot:jgi/Chrzof1/8766/Cz03g23210.t1
MPLGCPLWQLAAPKICNYLNYHYYCTVSISLSAESAHPFMRILSSNPAGKCSRMTIVWSVFGVQCNKHANSTGTYYIAGVSSGQDH